MQARAFGPNGTRMPLLGLGCSRIGSFNNGSSPRRTMTLLERSLELGVCLFDTADAYGQGDSERAIGRVLKGRRDAGIILTKGGIVFSAKVRLVRPLKPILKPLILMTPGGRQGMAALRKRTVGYDFAPERIQLALEGSLRRLKTDVIDVYMLHDAPPSVIEDARIVEALTRLSQAGKIKAYGVSCRDQDSLSAALRMPGLQAVEVTEAILDEMSADERRSLISRKIGVVVREALRARASRTPRQVIESVLQRNDVTSVVVGTTSIAHLEELAAATEPEAIC